MQTVNPIAEYEDEEFDDMGSHNHSMVQANLAHLFKRLGTYTVYIELSLDVSSLDREIFDRSVIKDEAIPDLCIYPKRPLSLPIDILRMSEMPLLALEILSPRQGTYSILQKFAAYFALGIQSCWLIEPSTKVVHVYSSPTQWTTFITGDVVDDSLDIQMPVAEIFE